MIRADNVTVNFRHGLLRRNIRALDGFSLDVKQGDVFGLLGPNGAGKSTAMYCILGLITPDSGSVTVFNKKPYPGAPMFGNIAYLPEEPHYHLYLTVEEAVSYYASLYGKGITRERVLRVIDGVGLTKFRKLRLSKCSKGMKQKVGIAQCLIKTPRLLLMDEPTRGLDPVMVKDFRSILLKLNKRGTTIVLNSHILSEVEMICNRVAIVKDGKVVAQDSLKNLLRTDHSTYEVVFKASVAAPTYVKVISKRPDSTSAEIPASELETFIGFIRNSGGSLFSCSMKRSNLEDAFYKILQGGPKG